MTVWIVNPFDNLPMEGNRPQRYWLMAEAFARDGWKVVYWTSDFNHGQKRPRRFASDAVAPEGIRVEMIPTHPYGKNVCLARIVSHLLLARDFRRRACVCGADRAERPDLVIASTPPLGLCSAALEVAKKWGSKFVCDIQDAWPETFDRLLPARVKPLGKILFCGMRRTARKIYRDADLVTGVCQRYAELSGRADFYLSYHGISGSSTVSRTRNGKRRLVYVGNLGSGYDLATVIRALSMRDELSLDIAGLGPREEELRRLVHALSLETRVRFHGYLGADDLRTLMEACEVGVIPMRDDSWVGLPYKLGDYFKAGLRVVSSLHGECGAWLARTGFGRTYENGSPASLLAALDALRPAHVEVPEALRAETIYPSYLQRLKALFCYNNQSL